MAEAKGGAYDLGNTPGLIEGGAPSCDEVAAAKNFQNSTHPGRRRRQIRRARRREEEAVYAAVLKLRRLGVEVWRQPGGIHLVGRNPVSLDDQALLEYAARRRGPPVQLDLFQATG
jgi:DNA-binding transcriptional MocR family regulator